MRDLQTEEPRGGSDSLSLDFCTSNLLHNRFMKRFGARSFCFSVPNPVLTVNLLDSAAKLLACGFEFQWLDG